MYVRLYTIFLPRRFVQNEILIQWDDGFNDLLPEICTAVVTGLKKKNMESRAGIGRWNDCDFWVLSYTTRGENIDRRKICTYYN